MVDLGPLLVRADVWMWLRIGHNWPAFDRGWVELNDIWPGIGQLGPDFGHNWPGIDQIWPDTKCGQNPRRAASTNVGVGRNSTKLCQVRPGID